MSFRDRFFWRFQPTFCNSQSTWLLLPPPNRRTTLLPVPAPASPLLGCHVGNCSLDWHGHNHAGYVCWLCMPKTREVARDFVKSASHSDEHTLWPHPVARRLGEQCFGWTPEFSSLFTTLPLLGLHAPSPGRCFSGAYCRLCGARQLRAWLITRTLRSKRDTETLAQNGSILGGRTAAVIVSGRERDARGEAVGKPQLVAKTGLKTRKAEAICLGFLVLTQSTPWLDTLA